MKYVLMLVVTGLTAAALLTPDRSANSPADQPALSDPLFEVCQVDEGGGRSTELTTLSGTEGPVRLTLFTGGRTAGSIGVMVGPSGSTVIPIVDVAAVGKVGGLVELPSPSSATAAITRSQTSLAGETCIRETPESVYLTGGTTADGRSFEIHLMNPFAGEAVVDLTVTSEVGLESNDRFQSLIVPAMSSVNLDLADLVPGRVRLSARVDTSTGRVIVAGRQEGEADSALWNGVPAAADWTLPVPSGVAQARLRVGNPSGQDVDYQIDVYSSSGLVEAVVSDVVAAGGEAIFDLATLVTDATVRGVRVISTSPVVAMLWIESETMLAATTGADTPADLWLLPGAAVPGNESQHVMMLNPGLEDARVTLRSVRVVGEDRSVIVPAQSVIELLLDPADGFRIEASVPIVAMVMTTGQGPGALAIGAGFVDG